MTKLLWDQTGERIFETGVDRGVLYLNGTAIPWNGLTSVKENLAEQTAEAFYFDGVKYIDSPAMGDYASTIRAYTYPDEFCEYEGDLSLDDGLYATNQGNKSFGMTYRTLVGDDLSGIDAGYKIHILYNLTAIPEGVTYQTLNSSAEAFEFGWTVTSTPDRVTGFRATAHAIVDSRYLPSELLGLLEDILYGTETEDAELPTLQELTDFLAGWGLITITDNGNGTWQADGPDTLITMLDSTTFQITGVNAIYLDADTYEVSTT